VEGKGPSQKFANLGESFSNYERFGRIKIYKSHLISFSYKYIKDGIFFAQWLKNFIFDVRQVGKSSLKPEKPILSKLKEKIAYLPKSSFLSSILSSFCPKWRKV
jgi:hypothetical protein